MMYVASFYVVNNIEGTRTVATEEVTLCSECLRVESPHYFYPTLKPNICVRCGVKNFLIGRAQGC